MKSALFAGQRIWLWSGLDADVQKHMWTVLHQNGAALQEGAWLEAVHANDEFLVVDNVDKVEVQDLRTRGGTILGIEFINQSVSHRLPLPKLGRILCCRALESHKVCLTGFSDSARVKLSSRLIAMGAECTNVFDGTITNVVSKTMYTDKCKWAVSKKKVVVTSAWVDECWTRHAALPEEDFRMPVFLGLTICCTSLLTPEKLKVKKLIAEHGGTYSADLHPACTHLICGSTASKKYQAAYRTRKYHIVTLDWLYKSIEAKGCLEETNFPPKPPKDEAPQGSLRSASQTSFGQPARLASGTQGSLTLTRVQATSAEEESFGRTESGKHASTAGRSVDMEVDDRDTLFLSSCRLFFAGMTKEENREALQMMRASGATRYAILDDRATHVVLGDNPNCDLTEVQKLEAAGIVEVVWLSWLRGCLQYRKLLPVSEKHRVPRQRLAGAKPKGASSRQQLQIQGPAPPVSTSQQRVGPVISGDENDDDSPNEPGSIEWEKFRVSQKQASQANPEGLGDAFGEGLGEGLGEVGDEEEPVLEMQSDLFDDASRTGFGNRADVSKQKADISTRALVLAPRFISPKRGISSSQKEPLVASPKLAAAFVDEGGSAKAVMGPPPGKWLAAARSPVQNRVILNLSSTQEIGLKACGETLKSGQSKPAHFSGPSHDMKAGSLDAVSDLKVEASFRLWAGATQSEATPTSTQLPESSSVFSGRRFYVDANIDVKTMEYVHIKDLLGKGRGEIVASLSEEVDYFVVLHGSDTSAVELPRGTERVTAVWLVQCLKENCLLSLDDRLFFRPMPYSIPLPCFKKIVICPSRYDDQKLLMLRWLAKCLGAAVRDKLSSATTHLVARVAAREKYQLMMKLKKPVVTLEWLQECAHKGCMVPVDDFVPPPPKPADINCTPSQAGPSQQSPAETDARKQTSMPPPRTRGSVRSTQSSQLPSQSQRKRGKKESPPAGPGDFEKLDDLAATWTSSQAATSPMKAPLNLQTQLEPKRNVHSKKLNSPEQLPFVATRRALATGDALERNDSDAREAVGEKEKRVGQSYAIKETYAEEKRSVEESSREKRKAGEETPSRNTRSRKSTASENEAKGKRKSDGKDLPNYKEPASDIKRQIREGSKRVAEGSVQKLADAQQSIDMPNTARDESYERVEAPKGSKEVLEERKGPNAEGLVNSTGLAGRQEESPESDMLVQVLGLLEKIPMNQSSGQTEEQSEARKRPRVAKAWPAREPAVLPRASEGPWTRQRTAVVPAVPIELEDRFQESQMESQMVGYDDGSATGQELIERLHLRKRAALSSSSRGAKLPLARNERIKNLIETANGNL